MKCLYYGKTACVRKRNKGFKKLTEANIVRKGRDKIIKKKILAIGATISAIIVGAYNGDSNVEKVKPEVFVEQEHTNLLVQGNSNFLVSEVKVKPEVSVELEHTNRKVAEYTNLLVSEGMELGKILANETGFEEKSVKVNFMPISGGDYPDIVCLIILSTENKINKTTEQLIVKNIMTFVSDIKNKLREEQIFILNEKWENITIN
ncbi:hypothetical protein [Psychrobacillus sp. L4]|uniref:hypothetical protein n=1 Tax=Psychrobacillus sp. L4 TaxID=3236892 RepID=UPI0036F316D2